MKRGAKKLSPRDKSFGFSLGSGFDFVDGKIVPIEKRYDVSTEAKRKRYPRKKYAPVKASERDFRG